MADLTFVARSCVAVSRIGIGVIALSVAAAPAQAGVVRVELEGGGILYTNDPARGGAQGAAASEGATAPAEAAQPP